VRPATGLVGLEEQRHDLNQAADADDEQRQHDQQTEVLFDFFMRNH
jgi:hypothetical protein